MSGPTHIHGNTLDLVISAEETQLGLIEIEPAGIISDHGLVTCDLPLKSGFRSIVHRFRSVRSWKAVDREKLRSAIQNSAIGGIPDSNTSAIYLFKLYDNTLRNLADRLAPSHSIKQRYNYMTPWFDGECRSLRRRCRRLERRYRKSNELADRLEWITALHEKHTVLDDKESKYWINKIDGERSLSMKMEMLLIAHSIKATYSHL